MKLCFLTGANSIHSYRWIKYFVEQGHEVHWISFTPLTIEGAFEKIKLYLFEKPESPFDFIGKVIKVRKLISKIRPDILHAHYLGINGIMGAFSLFHPFIFTAWGSDIFFGSKHKLRKPLIKLVLRRADLITCNGKELREKIEELGAASQKIRFVYWGIDTQEFKIGPKNEKLRERLGIFDSPVIISLRWLEPIYNIDSLINAVPLVLKDVPEVKFIIAGTGSQEKKLKKIVSSLGILDNVKFVGLISHKEVPDYLRLADIYISTSLSDGGLSQGTGQAMACELPVIITDLEVNRDWIKDGENGLLTPIKNPKSLAKKIITLLKNQDLRLKLGKNGRKTIEDKLNYYKEMEKAETLYNELVNKYNIK